MLWISYNIWRVGFVFLVNMFWFVLLNFRFRGFFCQANRHRKGKFKYCFIRLSFLWSYAFTLLLYNAVVESFSWSLTLLWILKFTFYYFEECDLLKLEGHHFIGFVLRLFGSIIDVLFGMFEVFWNSFDYWNTFWVNSVHFLAALS